MHTPLAPSGHCTLSPSKAHRWIACPGSIAAEAPFPDTSSKYADEGSAAHLLAAQCLETGTDAAIYLGHKFPEYPKFPVTAEMAEHVQVYLDFVRGLWAFCDETWIERGASLDATAWHLPEPIGGTSDAGGVDFTQGVIHVTDLKYGRGMLVEPEQNEQFMLYALIAYTLLSVEQRNMIHTVTMHVVQPRAEHVAGPIREASIPIRDLLWWARETMAPAAWAALSPGALITPGDHCGFCKAKPTCVAFRQRSFAVMPFTFEDVKPEPTTFIETRELTPERVGEIYTALPKLEAWIDAFRSFVYNEVSNGRAVPGVGMKAKRTNRKWLDEQMVMDFYLGDPETLAAPHPLSVAQLEKVAKKQGWSFPDHLVVKDEGELTLCAADDPHALTTLPTAAATFQFEELP